MRVGRPAITIKGDVYVVSMDKGNTWDGPFAYLTFGRENTSRTSYMILGRKKMLAFMSHNIMENTLNKPFYDRAFASITLDGCKTWHFVGDITDDEARSVMPIIVKLDDGTLVAAYRRRLRKHPVDDVWIEVKRSTDEGRTWHSPVRAAVTYNPDNPANSNGNPHAMCRLKNGTIVLAYGRREHGRSSIRYCISTDGGLSFHSERIIREDAIDMDMGYPRICAGPDGKCVVVYYIATKERPVQHIEATVFDPLQRS
ncbi:MAG: exo-alpha-sialidase [Clostridiaceae bacterium]|nr:exo-alpha-sialidase [Clostridiaceae bacterium]